MLAGKRDRFGADKAAERAERKVGDLGRRIIHLAADRRVFDGERLSGDVQRGAAEPVFVVLAAHFDVNSITARVGIFGHFGKIISFAVERVADLIACLDSGKGKGMRLPVISRIAADK